MYYNTHIHTFKHEDVPEKFLPLKLVRYLAGFRRARRFVWILNAINPFSDKDFLSRYARFLEIGKMPSQEAIFEECQKFYPAHTRFIVLPMDMAYMKAGKVPRPYEQQIEELGEMAVKIPEVIPFFAVDPRRDNILELLKESVEKWNFRGIKLYTPLGYFPYDKRLYPIYEYCEKNKLPVVSHCSPYNLVHYRGTKKEVTMMLEDKQLSERVLFGSDYYMVETQSNERRFGLDFRAFIGEDKFNQIASLNPKRFLS